MRASLHFKLPEEQEEFRLAKDGVLYSIVIEDLDSWLRAKVKYTEQTDIKIEDVRAKLSELLQERGL